MSRTSFLTYFQQLSLTQRSNNDTPSAFRPNIHREWSSPYFRSEKIGDEEVQPEHNAHDDTPHLECTRCGNPATKISKKTRPGFYDIWSVVCVVSFTCLLVLFALDLTFGLYGMGTGAAECMVQTSATSSQKNDQMQFCLVSPNRQAPGPQTWRLLPTESQDVCATEVVTLLADQTAQWNMRTGDRIAVDRNWVELDLI